MSQQAIQSNPEGLIVPQDLTMRRFVTDAFGETRMGDEFPAVPDPETIAIICPRCQRLLKETEECCGDGIAILVNNKVLAMKMVEFAEFSKTLPDYEQFCFCILFQVCSYLFRGGQIEEPTTMDALQALEILEVINLE